ncbi:DUF438 domain-containing protein [Streptococcus chenjunshii]|uniref:DUF438 domain-containing protein n=1 Tax=Streptococcus chenjunshii TaxID=2173853 RepID=A0A372KPT3_9STRE|nr:DUF438 domain-containing protein [Streptococcus chenjunshii]AXQ78742.1 DUF438 domain-containing protein [Streptococcus chenjunshii]RFU51665.1 DUF438 domain-containing protein [Streptococcus chenjunshii]RFU53986.1 DUF438 domain-containing protein [Streptococcus chenjunshii]
MAAERIEILKDILLDLHHGASPDSVQERFNQHFSGVSALEISLMEHELMSSDTGITFEDVMSLCNVHANLFKGAIAGVEMPDSEREGHPVKVFKDENLALRAALLRIRRIIANYTKPENRNYQADLIKGLKRQFQLLGQFENHYTRKEKVFFPIMESYGHDAPPKVMWGVDDEIRELFDSAQTLALQLPQANIAEVSEKFEVFAKEFEEMIFKEESILLMILLEIFTQDDWLAVAEESDVYGYAVIKPAEKWEPDRSSFSAEQSEADSDSRSELTAEKPQIIETPAGQFTITFTPKEEKTAADRTVPQPFGNGYLSVEQADLLLNHLPFEITFVNKDDIFQYYNNSVPAEEMIFKRTPSQIGRNVELCHPPKVLDKVKKIFELLRSGQRDKVEMWFKSERLNKFVYVTYAAVRDDNGDFQGVLEYVQNIQPFFDLDGDYKRDL